MPDELTLTQIEAQSVQDLPDAQKNGAGLSLFGYLQRGPLLPAYGTRIRERALRNLYRQDYNWMVQGAFAGVMNIIASTPWEIKGPEDLNADETKFWHSRYKAANNGKQAVTNRPDIEYYQEILRQADFGRGWGSFCKKGVDYLRQDGGWFWELIAPGNPLKPPTGPVTGLAHLDSLRCIPTGDPEYPVIYYSRYNKYHLMHTSRVVQLVDMPDGDEYFPGYGLCALSRAAAISWREILVSRYIESHVDDKPPPGIVVAKGMVKAEREAALNAYRTEQGQDEQPPWGKQLWFYGADPSLDVKIEAIPFSQAPEKFDFREYTELDVDALALAIGVDKQDLWQLTGGHLGSGAQSEILNQKSRGKLIGSLRSEMERHVNDILPEEYEFAFKFSDPQEDTQKATVATSWATVASDLKAGGIVDASEARALLADTVDEIKDAISDENGNIVEVGDTDIQPPVETLLAPPPAQALAAPVNASAPNVPGQRAVPQPQPTAKSLRERPGLDSDVGGRGDTAENTKAIQSTLIDFEDAFADTIKARLDGDISGLRFGIVARDLLRVNGLKAFRDGLEDGGVPQMDDSGANVPLDSDDESLYLSWLTQQSAYVSDFGRSLTKGAAIDPQDRATLWGNKSLLAIYQQGRASADANGMYEWQYGDAEHCKDCKRLNGQVHRLKSYMRSGWMPQGDKLTCKGFNCQCRLLKTTARANGRF